MHSSAFWLLALLVTLHSFLGNTLSVSGEKTPKYNRKNPFKQHSKIAITSYFAPGTPYETFLESIVSPNKAAYAAKNGYDYINAFEHEDILQLYNYHKKIHPFEASHYFKLRLITYLMERYRYEWIMWSDGDAIFLNFQEPLEQFLDSDYNVIYASSNPLDQKWIGIINTGHFFVRASQWSYKFFHEAYALSFINCWVYMEGKPALNNWLNMCKGRDEFILADQRILQFYASYMPHEHYGCHVKHHSMRDFDSEFPEYEPGDLVVHFPGRKMQEKIELIKGFLQNANPAGGFVDWDKFPQLKGQKGQVTRKMAAFDKLNRKCK